MKKLLILCFVSAIVLSACSSSPDPYITEQENSSDNSSQSTSDNILDNKIFQQAVQENNLAKCSEILDEAMQNECDQIVDSVIKTQNASADLSVSDCDDIKLERYRENCISLVKEAQQEKIDRQNSDAELEQVLKDRESLNSQALANNDISYCKDIGDKNFVQECIYNVIISPDYPATSSSVCAELDNQGLRDLCESDPKWSN